MNISLTETPIIWAPTQAAVAPPISMGRAVVVTVGSLAAGLDTNGATASIVEQLCDQLERIASPASCLASLDSIALHKAFQVYI